MLTRFKTKKIYINITVGECLKKKREEMGISIKQISEKLKIRISYIEDLEENNYNKLPPDVYVKGFVKSYSKYIGFDPEKMARLYGTERAIGNKIENKKNPKKKKKKKDLFISKYVIITPKILTVFFSLFFLLIIGYYLWYQISSFNSVPYLFISSPVEDMISETLEIEVAGQTEKEAVIKINGEEVFVDSEGYFSEIILLKPGNNILNIEAINRFNKSDTRIRNIIYKKTFESVPTNINKTEDVTSEENLDLIENIEFIRP